MKWKKIEMPKQLLCEKETLTDFYGKFYAEPFERGYAVTIGNSICRILLSSIQAAAVVSVKFDGVLHEFSTIPGVVEDMTNVILNIKKLKLKLNTDKLTKIYLSAHGEKEVTAADIKPDAALEILNPNLHIATLTSNDAKFNMEMEVDTGRGYIPAERNKRDDQAVGVIPIDSIFSPVSNVKFYFESARVGQMTDYEKLVMEIWTDGRIKPDDALGYAAKILKDHLTIFINFEEEPVMETIEKEVDEKFEKFVKDLGMSVDELELSVRAANCLKNANIKTIYELVQKTETDMLKYKNFGRKSLSEIKSILTGMGISLGVKLEPEVLQAIKEKKKRRKLEAQSS